MGNLKYPNFTKIFTDGSKTSEGTGCSFFVDVTPPVTVRSRLPNTCGIFNAEMYALLIALHYIEGTNDDNFVIFSDSCSSLQYLCNSKLDHWIKIKIHKLLNASAKNIVFEYVPGHTNIKGNDQADLAAKQSISDNFINNIPLSYSDYKHLIKTKIHRLWQRQWSTATCRLHDFKPILGDWKSSYKDNRKDEKILSRLRTGTCKFHIKIYLPTDNEPEICQYCQIEMSLEHLLVTCPALQQHLIPIKSHLNRKNKILNECNI